MFIVWICGDNTVNVPYTIVRAINKFTPHQALLIQSYRTYLKWPNEDIYVRLTPEMTVQEFKDIISRADVIHLNDSHVGGRYPVSKKYDFKDGYINLFELFTEKQRVFRQANGTYYRTHHEEVNRIVQEHNVYLTSSTPDLCMFGDSTWIPSPIPMWEEEYSFHPAPYEPGMQIGISHICNHLRRKTDNKMTDNSLWKGTDNFLKVCEDHFPDVKVVLVSNKSHLECMEMRKNCQIHYDQFWGAYGLSSLEGATTGQITTVGLSQVKRFIPENPFIDMDISKGSYAGIFDGISKAVKLLKSPDRLEYLKYGREWIRKWHSDKTVARYLIDLYEHAGFWR